MTTPEKLPTAAEPVALDRRYDLSQLLTEPLAIRGHVEERGR